MREFSKLIKVSNFKHLNWYRNNYRMHIEKKNSKIESKTELNSLKQHQEQQLLNTP